MEFRIKLGKDGKYRYALYSPGGAKAVMVSTEVQGFDSPAEAAANAQDIIDDINNGGMQITTPNGAWVS